MHHTYTNIVGMDRDVGYGILRMSKDQRWNPYFLGNPVYAFLLMVLFQYGVALHELETERIRAGEITIADKREILEGIWRKTKRQTLKDYVAFPLLAGPFAPWVFAGNMTANLIRNVWSYMIIFCGHFPEDVQEFSIEETKAETRGGWYFRQILGSANLTGGKLFHILSGNLSFQIEHHLFPDVPAHRHAEIAPRGAGDLQAVRHPLQQGSLPKQFAHRGAQDRQARAALTATDSSAPRNGIPAGWTPLCGNPVLGALPSGSSGTRTMIRSHAAVRLDGRAAASARLAGAAVHPDLLPAPGVAGGGPIEPRPVQPQHVARPLHHPQRILHRADGRAAGARRRSTARCVHVADACHHSLVEQCLGQRPIRIGDQVRRGDVRIPVRRPAGRGRDVRRRPRRRSRSRISSTPRSIPAACTSPASRMIRMRCPARLGRVGCCRPTSCRPSSDASGCSPAPTRMNRCLPRLTTSSTRWPVRSTVA